MKKLIIAMLVLLLFVSCAKTKETDKNDEEEMSLSDIVSETKLLDSFFESFDETLLSECIGKKIETDLDTEKYIAYGGFPFALKKFLSKEQSFYVGFINIAENREKGCVILFIKHSKDDDSDDIWNSYLLDAKYIPAKEGYRVHEDYICYDLRQDGTCKEDQTKYGITLMPLNGWLSYNVKHIPMYILSFSEDKMIFS